MLPLKCDAQATHLEMDSNSGNFLDKFRYKPTNSLNQSISSNSVKVKGL